MHTPPATRFKSLRLATILATAFASAAIADTTPVADPVPDVAHGDIVVGTRVVAEIPRIDDAPDAIEANDAFARIQNLVPAPDGSDSFYVNDERGVIYHVHPTRDGQAGSVEPYLDLRSMNLHFTNAPHGNESGLMGFAFHPDFLKVGQPGYGKLYVNFSTPTGTAKCDFFGDKNESHESVVGEFTARDPAASKFDGTSREILRIGQPGKNHNIGTMAFNPNAKPGEVEYGLLYISMGDGIAQYDPMNLGQTRTDPMGSILRINPLQDAKGEKYMIPADNPFKSEPSAAPLVWAYGLRHPQHFSFDTGGRHRMYIAEMGQDQVEEVNLGVRGGNYGWSLREGTYATGQAVGERVGPVYPKPAKDEADYLYPVAQYDHDDGKAISSVVVYRGTAIPALSGKLLCADIVNGRIFYVDEASLEQGKQTPLKELRLSFDGTERELTDVTQHSGYRVDLRLGTDAKGEVYLLTKSDGKIRQLVPVATKR